MNPRISSAILFMLSLGSLAVAGEALVITQAQGEVHHHIYAAPSPIPGWCYWEQEVPTPYFHATNEDGYGNMDCPHEFLAHCDTDSMVFHGTWPFIDSEYVTGAQYEAFLACTVTLAAPCQLTASRAFSGTLTSQQMDLTLVHPSGAQEEILGEGSLDLIELTLDPGTYTLQMDVDVYRHLTYPEQLQTFECRVAMVWSDPGQVAVQPVTWDSLKSRYR